MSDRSRRKDILARIESGELSAEEGIRALQGIEESSDASPTTHADVEVDVEHEAQVEHGDERIDVELEDAGPRRKVVKVIVDRDGRDHETEVDRGGGPMREPRGMRINLAGFLGGDDARRLRLRINDGGGDDDQVRIDLPVGIAEAGLRLLERMDPEGRWAEHRDRLRGEGEHTLLEVVEDDGERVRISIV